jgi:hypothetical protein
MAAGAAPKDRSVTLACQPRAARPAVAGGDLAGAEWRAQSGGRQMLGGVVCLAYAGS